eukprot:1325948-Amorphochlora_amoeboformis.AAC.2
MTTARVGRTVDWGLGGGGKRSAGGRRVIPQYSENFEWTEYVLMECLSCFPWGDGGGVRLSRSVGMVRERVRRLKDDTRIREEDRI